MTLTSEPIDEGDPAVSADTAARMREAIDLHRAGRIEDAAHIYTEILRREPANCDALNLAGVCACQRGDHAAGIDLIRRAIEGNPGDAAYWLNLGHAQMGAQCPEQAEPAYRRALAILPGYVPALRALAKLLRKQGRAADAILMYRQLAQAAQARAADHFHLADLLERSNSPGEAMRAVSSGCGYFPDHLGLQLVAARCERRAGRPDAGAARLAARAPATAESPYAIDIQFELGMIHDRLGDADRAFGHFAEAKRLAAVATPGWQDRRDAFLHNLLALETRFTPEWVRSWTSAGNSGDARAPVFLIGFPRSGTTLLDLILSGHPDIRTLEEKPVLKQVRQAVNRLPGKYPAALARLAPEELAQLRNTYASAAERLVAGPPGILLDKLPLNIVHAGLIHRLFPAAKVVVALRHPCDAVLSCFMQRFGMNYAMANFFSIADAATAYAAVMSLWQRYVEVLPIHHHVVRYEDLIDDTPATAQALFRYLEIDWTAEALNHAARARTRAIDTPSYHQVSEPIYDRARYRWRQYGAHLQPVKEILGPFIERLGYGS